MSKVIKAKRHPGQESTETLGWWYAHRFMVLRRLSQITVLALFMATPLLGIRLLDGNLSSSRILNTVPMTDPLLALQSLAAFHRLELTAILGALFWWQVFTGLLVVVHFAAGSAQINPITDFANVLRRKLEIRSSPPPASQCPLLVTWVWYW